MNRAVGWFKSRDEALAYLCDRHNAYCDIRSQRLIARDNINDVYGHVYIFEHKRRGHVRFDFEIGA